MDKNKVVLDYKAFINVAELIQKLFAPGDFLRGLTDVAHSAHTFDFLDEFKKLDPHYFLMRVIEEIALPYQSGQGKSITDSIAKGIYTIYSDFGNDEMQDSLDGIMLSFGHEFSHSYSSHGYLQKLGHVVQIFFEMATASTLLRETEKLNEQKS
jgi:hypothetical protein